MSKNNTKQQQKPSFYNYQYYFVIAAVATAIAGIVHLYVPFSHSAMPKLSNYGILYWIRNCTNILDIAYDKEMGKTMVLHRNNIMKCRFHNIICNNTTSGQSCYWKRRYR